MAADDMARAFASISGVLVRTHDTTGTLSLLLDESITALAADACGILVNGAHGRLELLSASSHRAGELELLESQIRDGPCVEAWSTATAVSAASIQEADERWPGFGQAMAARGYATVHACPLRWGNEVLGAMNVFRAASAPFATDDHAVAQAFADLATLVVVTADRPTLEAVTVRIADALNGRVVVEQAKGVLAHRLGLEPDDAYQALRDQARTKGQTLSDMAREVLLEAQRRP